MNKRRRDIQVKFYVDEKELEQINRRVRLANMTNRGAYLRKMAIASWHSFFRVCFYITIEPRREKWYNSIMTKKFKGEYIMSEWSSEQYLKFKNQRSQPSLDLISRLSEIEPKRTLDIGCGPGNSTAALAKAFPDTELIGIDASEDMLIKARKTYPDISFIRGFIPDDLDKLTGKFDLIFSNACIHWIPNQKQLINSVFEKLADNGYFAVQIPMIQEAPFYKLLNELTALPKWEKLSDVKNFHNLLPEEYYDLFSALNCDFEMWQTSYYHIMDDFKKIIEWYRGSGLRPYLDRLSQSEQENLINDLLYGLKDYYTMQADGKVILKMPRLFFILRKS